MNTDTSLVITVQASNLELFGQVVHEEVESGFFSLNDLLSAYSLAKDDYNDGINKLENLMTNMDFIEKAYHLMHERRIIQYSMDEFRQAVKAQGLVSVMKQLNAWKTPENSSSNHTMVDPYIWVLCAMELNPIIYAKIVLWLGDSLIAERIEASKGFKSLCEAFERMAGAETDYDPETIRDVINNRNDGTSCKDLKNPNKVHLRKVVSLQNSVLHAINAGYIKSYHEALDALKTFRC